MIPSYKKRVIAMWRWNSRARYFFSQWRDLFKNFLAGFFDMSFYLVAFIIFPVWNFIEILIAPIFYRKIKWNKAVELLEATNDNS